MQSKVGRFFIGILLAVAAFAAYFGISNLISVFFLFSISPILLSQNPDMTPQEFESKLQEGVLDAITPAIFVISTIVLVILFYAFFILVNKSFSQYTRLKKTDWSFLMISFFLGYALNMAVISLVELLPVPESWLEKNSEATTFYGPFLFVVLAVIVCAPLLEEVVFRGLIYTVIKKHSAAWIATLISATAFGVVHGNILQAIYAGFMGFMCVYVYEMSDSLFSSISLHVGFNCTFLINGLIGLFLGVDFEKLPTLPVLVVSLGATIVMMTLVFKLNRRINMHEIYIE